MFVFMIRLFLVPFVMGGGDCWAFSDAVLFVQERSSVIYTPRNLVFTAEPLVVSGKSITISLVIPTFRELFCVHMANWFTWFL